MRVYFHFGWVESPGKKVFKLKPAELLFQEYADRLQKFAPCESGLSLPQERGFDSTHRIWMCDNHQGAMELSSEQLARKVEALETEGARALHILIGGSDGFSSEQIKNFKPQLRWSFGKLTLPHELAAVVAGEQLYRAWSILRGLPYHLGHS